MKGKIDKVEKNMTKYLEFLEKNFFESKGLDWDLVKNMNFPERMYLATHQKEIDIMLDLIDAQRLKVLQKYVKNLKEE